MTDSPKPTDAATDNNRLSDAEIARIVARLEAMEGNGAATLLEAWLAINGPEPASGYAPRSDPPFCPKWEAYISARHRFRTLLHVRAYLEAAQMLVPHGWVWTVNTFSTGRAGAYCMNERDEIVRPKVQTLATPALALAAAAIRAHIIREGETHAQ